MGFLDETGLSRFWTKIKTWLSSNYVDLSNDQIVGGTKTFNASQVWQGVNIFHNPDVDASQSHASGNDNIGVLSFNDSQGTGWQTRLASLKTEINASDEIVISLNAHNPANGGQYSGIEAHYPRNGTPYATASQTSATRTGVSDIITRGYLDGSNSGVVHIAGTETIDGSKTFTLAVKIKNGSPFLVLEETDVAKGETSDGSNGIRFRDKNEKTLGVIESHFYGSSKDNSIKLNAYTGASASSNASGYVEQVYLAADSHARFRPGDDNVQELGDASHRWKQLHAGTTTIATSDERLKTSIESIPDAVLDAWGDVGWVQFQMLDAVADKGADKARLHSGMIAQRIDAVFKAHGLDASRWGLFCHDSWDAEDWDEKVVDAEAVVERVLVVDEPERWEELEIVDAPAFTDESGEGHPAQTHSERIHVPQQAHYEDRIVEPEQSHLVHHHRDAGDAYSLRYEEALCMEAACQRRRADRLEARIAALEAR